MQLKTDTADAALLNAYRDFTRADQALRAANDDRISDARLDIVVPPFNRAVEAVTQSEAATLEGVLAKARVLQRLLDEDGRETRAEELDASLIEDILRMG